MRLEQAAVVFFGLAVFAAAAGFFAVTFWDSLVAPAVELTRATVFTLRYPVTLGVLLVVGLLFVRHFSRGR